jgi:hypothetical protein
VLLAFRHVTDGSVPGDPDDPTATIAPGFWLRNVAVSGAPVTDGASLAGWPLPVASQSDPRARFTLQLVAYSSDGATDMSSRAYASTRGMTRSSTRKSLKRLFGKHGDVVGVVVMYDEPTERVTAHAPYRLTVNGVLHPGG